MPKSPWRRSTSASMRFPIPNEPHFMNLPTSFVLPAEDVDRLREIAGRLLRESVEFEEIVRAFGGTPAK